MANESIKVYGTTNNHIVAETGAVNDGAWSTTAMVDNVLDNSTIKYPYAEAILHIADFAAAPNVGGVIGLYRRDINVWGTAANDTPVPDVNYPGKWVGTFLVDAVDAEQYLFIPQLALGGWEQEFYLFNECGQNIVTTGGNWDLDIRPFTYGPAA